MLRRCTLWTAAAEFILDVSSKEDGQDETERPPRRGTVSLSYLWLTFDSAQCAGGRRPEYPRDRVVHLHLYNKRMTCTHRVAAVSGATPFQCIALNLKQLLDQEW